MLLLKTISAPNFSQIVFRYLGRALELLYQRQFSETEKSIVGLYCSFLPHFVRWIVTFIGYKHNIPAVALAERAWPDPYTLLHPFAGVCVTVLSWSPLSILPQPLPRGAVWWFLSSQQAQPLHTEVLLPLSLAFLKCFRACSLILTISVTKMSNLNVWFHIPESLSCGCDIYSLSQFPELVNPYQGWFCFSFSHAWVSVMPTVPRKWFLVETILLISSSGVNCPWYHCFQISSFAVVTVLWSYFFWNNY